MAVELESQGQLQEVLEILRKRKWQVLLPFLFVTSIGVVFAVIVPKKYAVGTVVEVREQRPLEGTEEGAAQRELASAEDQIRSYSRVQDVIEHQNWLDYTRLSGAEQDRFVRSVMANIDVTVRPKPKNQGSTFVEIGYADVDPNRAVQFLKELTNRWMQDVLEWERIELENQRDVLQNLAEEAEVAHREAVAAYYAMRSEMQLPPVEAEGSRDARDPVYEMLVKARSERDRVAAELDLARAKLEKLEDQLATAPRMIEREVPEQGVAYTKQLADMEAAILALRGQQAGLKPANSAYKRAERQIQDLERQMEMLTELQRESTTRQELVPNELVPKLQQQVADLEREIAGLVASHEQWDAAVAEQSRTWERRGEEMPQLEQLRVAWEQADLDLLEADADLREVEAKLAVVTRAMGDPARIVQEPIPPSRPTEPNPWLLIAFFAVGGLGLGLAIAFLIEFSRTCFRSVHDITRVMGVPVLGAVGYVRTREEIRRERARRAVVAASSAVIVLGLGWFAWAWTTDPDQLPTEVVRAVEDFQLKFR